jgi:hypothetical protein
MTFIKEGYVRVIIIQMQSAVTCKLIPSRFHIIFEEIIQLVGINSAVGHIIIFTCSEPSHFKVSPQNLLRPSTDR